MTAQIGDRFKYKGSEYTIVAFSDTVKFNPKQYGIIPESCCSACGDGYWCEYEISEKGIILKNLYVNSKDSYYPEINGVLPLRVGKIFKKPFKYMGHHCYKGIDIVIPYTGEIVVGKDFLHEYYIHSGYQRAWSYEVLKEFVFKEGLLVNVVDHSDVAKKLRQKIKENPDLPYPICGEIPMILENRFDWELLTKAWKI